jgi:hypothetical protein
MMPQVTWMWVEFVYTAGYELAMNVVRLPSGFTP